MALTDYTSYAEIRTVLGVTEQEIEDSELALGIRTLELEMDFDRVHPNLATVYDLHKANPTTQPQRRLVRAVPVFAAYSVALRLLASVPVFAPKKITDGRAEVERIADPYKHLRAELGASYDQVVGIIIDALEDLGEVVGTVGTLVYAMSSVTIDPVTGAAR